MQTPFAQFYFSSIVYASNVFAYYRQLVRQGKQGSRLSIFRCGFLFQWPCFNSRKQGSRHLWYGVISQIWYSHDLFNTPWQSLYFRVPPVILNVTQPRIPRQCILSFSRISYLTIAAPPTCFRPHSSHNSISPQLTSPIVRLDHFPNLLVQCAMFNNRAYQFNIISFTPFTGQVEEFLCNHRK